MDEHGAVWFRHSDTEDLTLITPEMYPFVMPHGEVGLAECARLADQRRGGYAAIACGRGKLMAASTFPTNGTHGPTGQQVDIDIDTLYSFWSGQTRPQPCPEALFSCTLKGTIGGHETLLTVRHEQRGVPAKSCSITGMLDPVPAKASSPQGQPQEGPPQCPQHGALKRSTKGKGYYCPAKNADGSWCNSKGKSTTGG